MGVALTVGHGFSQQISMRIASKSFFSMRDSFFNSYPNICAGQNWPQKSNARPVERELTVRFLANVHARVRCAKLRRNSQFEVISLKWNILGQITL